MIITKNEKHTLNWMLKKAKSNLLDFDLAIQRGKVWTIVQKSNFIVSVLLGIPIESLLLEEDGFNVGMNAGYLVLDGKQRINALIDFINGEYVINSKVKHSVVEGIELVGKSFDELPDFFQETILDYELSYSVLSPLEDDERELVFFMRNQATKLCTIDIIRVVAGIKVLDKITSLIKHPVMEYFMFPKERNNESGFIFQVLSLMIRDNVGFSKKELEALALELNETGLSDGVVEEIMEVSDYMTEAFGESNVKLKKNIAPFFFMMAKSALKDGIEPNTYLRAVEKFLAYPPSAYLETIKDSMNSKNNVQRRLNIVNDYYKKGSF